MSEKPQSGAQPEEPTIDPIAFDDRTIFGLDPAVHWVHFNDQPEQFTEIVVEITKHWDDGRWLEKLLNRLGYTADLYDPDTNPKGIYDRVLPSTQATSPYAYSSCALLA
jgi:hypothetical protein